MIFTRVEEEFSFGGLLGFLFKSGIHGSSYRKWPYRAEVIDPKKDPLVVQHFCALEHGNMAH